MLCNKFLLKIYSFITVFAFKAKVSTADEASPKSLYVIQ